MELQKHYYLFLQTILVNGVGSVYTNPLNATRLPQILETVVQGCKSADVTVQKICVSILKRMVEEWGGIETFNSFLFERVVPRLFETPLNPSFDLNDASSNALVLEIAKLLKLITGKTGAAFVTFLGNVYLPSLQCPPEFIQQFVLHLDKSPIKQFHEFFKGFVRMKRS